MNSIVIYHSGYLTFMMQDRRNHSILFLFLLCFVPSLQQGWTGNNAMQPSWQSQGGAAQTQTVQAQPIHQPSPQSWDQPTQQQPAQTQQAPGDQQAAGSGVGVRMKSIRTGDGKTFPGMGQNVTVHYTGKLYPSGQVFDSSVERGEPFKFTLGIGQVIRGWDIAVAHLTLGQKARFVVGPEYAYGHEGIAGTIPPDAILIFEIELISIQ